MGYRNYRYHESTAAYGNTTFMHLNWQQQYEVQRMLQEGRVHTWNVIKGWFKSLFGR